MHRRRPLAQPLVALALAALASAGGEICAGAAPSEAELDQARERFATARRLEDTGRWAEALSVLQRVAEVKMTPQVRFHVALCMENVGLWTHAMDGYALAATEAGTIAPEVVKEASEHLRKLEQTIPTVTLHVEGAAAGDEILLDRRPLSVDDRQPPLRTDPGPHTAEVRRGSAVVAREYFALDPRSALRIELRIGSIAPEPGEAPAPPGEAPPPPPARPRTPLQRSLGWAALGVGATSLAFTGVFVGLRANAMDRLVASCPTFTRCSPSVAPIVAAGKTDAALANVFGVFGGVAAAAGVVLLLTAPPPMVRVPSPRPPALTRRGPLGSGAPTAWLELCADGEVALGGTF